MSSADTETEQQPAVEVDTVRQGLLDELTTALGDALVGSHIQADDLWIRVRREDWRRAAEACKSLGFEYFDFLSGIDWMPSAPNPEDAETLSVEPDADADEASEPEPEPEPEPTPPAADDDAEGGWKTGWAGGETRFQVFARLHSIRRKLGVTLKADLDDDEPRVASIHDVYSGADWHERETWEMYGFVFEGHPYLKHIYLPGEFEGFPLRKDFPLLSREVKPWPGIVDVEDLPAAEEARQDAAINAAQPSEEGS